MKPIFVNRFDSGIADSRYSRNVGECSIAKHFDLLTFPYRLSPLRGMAADTANTAIGNLLIGSDGNFYGLGWDAAAHTNSAIWTRASGAWVQFALNVSDNISYNLFVEYHKSNGERVIVTGSTNNNIGITELDQGGATSHSLTYTNICQGFVHPKDDILYIGYDNKIAKNDNGSWTDIALTLPANYRITALTYFGDLLAIAACPSVNGVDYGGGGNNSKVFLWDRNTSVTILTEVIDWGTGNLKVLNNLDGVLIGVSDQGGSSSNILDRDSIVIHAYSGGAPQLIKEISTEKQTTTTPDATINPRVNFIYRNRLYFSIDILSGSTSPAYHGLWSIGLSKLSGRYSVSMERVATTDNSETTVLAAAISGDVTCIVYNAEGTLSITNTTSGTGAQYTATSVYESLINPNMPEGDYEMKKELKFFRINTMPLTSSGQIVVKYRVDGATSWTTIVTKTSTLPNSDLTGCYAQEASAETFVDARYYEFRIESTGGAEVTGFSYGYTTKNDNTT